MWDPKHGFVSIGLFDDGVELLYVPYQWQEPRCRFGRMCRFNTTQFNVVMAAAIEADTDPAVDALLDCLNLVYAFKDYRHRQHSFNGRGQFEGDCVIDLRAGGVSYLSMRTIQLTVFDMRDHIGSLESQLICWAARDRRSVLSPSLPKLVMHSNEEAKTELVSIAPTRNVEHRIEVQQNAAVEAAFALRGKLKCFRGLQDIYNSLSESADRPPSSERNRDGTGVPNGAYGFDDFGR